MEQLAYEDAVDVYGRALEVLELMDEPDEALRCSLLLSLGGAEAKSARVADARDALRAGRRVGPAPRTTPTAWSAPRSGSR